MTGLYKIKTASELTGFSTNLLRAWERRYDLLEPARTPAGHRLYTEDDLRVLKAVKGLLARGRTIGEVASMGRVSLLEMARIVPARKSESPGSDCVAVPHEYGELMPRLLQALRELDSLKARQIVEVAFSEMERAMFRGFVSEAGRQIGSLWSTGQVSVASEHLLSNFCKSALLRSIASCPSVQSGKKILLAGFPDELHELGLLLLHQELVYSGHIVTSFGPSLPLEDLEEAMLGIGPDLVCLSVTRPSVLRMHLPKFIELLGRNKDVDILLGGGGTIGSERRLAELGVSVWDSRKSLDCLAREVTDGFYT